MNADSQVIYAFDDDFESIVEQSDIPVLVDFWAPWCKPCLALEPTMEQLAVEFEGRAKIVKVNSDEATETAARFGIRGIPNVMLFNNGEKQVNATGVQPKKTYARFIEDALAASDGADGGNQRDAMLADNDFRANFIASSDLDELREAVQQNPKIATQPFDNGMTPIALVMRRRNRDRIDLILSAGPELTVHELAGLGRKDELLAALEETPDLLNEASPEGITPLGQAVRHQQNEVCKLLLDKGADPNLPKLEDSQLVPLVLAVLGQNAQAMKLLIDYGADLSVTARGGSTLLHMAVSGTYSNGQGYPELINILIKQGINTAVMDGSGKTPLEHINETHERRTNDERFSDAEKQILNDRLAQLTPLLT